LANQTPGSRIKDPGVLTLPHQPHLHALREPAAVRGAEFYSAHIDARRNRIAEGIPSVPFQREASRIPRLIQQRVDPTAVDVVHRDHYDSGIGQVEPDRGFGIEGIGVIGINPTLFGELDCIIRHRSGILAYIKSNRVGAPRGLIRKVSAPYFHEICFPRD
jgi:hypothetical protein